MAKKKKHPLALRPQDLTHACDPESLGFRSTAELPPCETIYGQPRGVRAIEFGLGMREAAGYHIFVLGPTGSGRLSTLRQFIHQHAQASPPPADWCYVYDFSAPQRPRALGLPAGQGRIFKASVELLLKTLASEIPEILASEAYLKARADIANQFEDLRASLLGQVQKQAQESGFSLQNTPQGALMIMPLREGRVLNPDAYERLSEAEKATITEKRRLLEAEVEEVFRQLRGAQIQAESALVGLRRQVAAQVLEAHLRPLQAHYQGLPPVAAHLEVLKEDILQHLDIFEGQASPGPARPEPPSDPLRRYAVNLLVENDPAGGAPVIYADLPTYRNLVGRIEHEARFGALTTDFMLIKSGALHRANGGFLILRAQDVLAQPLAWDALKRALAVGNIVIEDSQAVGMSVMATQAIEPTPIPLHLTVILVGSPDLYYTLYALDEDFRDLFRVKADFGETMPRTPENEANYAQFIATFCQQNGLPHLSAAAAAKVIEHGSWLVSDQRKLSTQFGALSLLVREAAYFAKQDGAPLVQPAHVRQALEERAYRNNEAEELALEDIASGLIFIDVHGEVVGQINGLVVMSIGDHSFGLPSRLTARVYVGREGVVHIDRESDMTGRIHDKGVMTLQGYLGGRYALDSALNFSASVSFEQNYGDVEGDSASSTELFALLSALSEYPIKQTLAVTGSVSQRGLIQPIGGVTQKIEGFFKVCQRLGWTKTQGVLIPRSNVQDLMLSEEVIAAVAAGEFHIYAIQTVDEGLALLTGQPAEVVHQAVEARLKALAQKLDDNKEEEGG